MLITTATTILITCTIRATHPAITVPKEPAILSRQKNSQDYSHREYCGSNNGGGGGMGDVQEPSSRRPRDRDAYVPREVYESTPTGRYSSYGKTDRRSLSVSVSDCMTSSSSIAEARSPRSLRMDSSSYGHSNANNAEVRSPRSMMDSYAKGPQAPSSGPISSSNSSFSTGSRDQSSRHRDPFDDRMGPAMITGRSSNSNASSKPPQARSELDQLHLLYSGKGAKHVYR